MQTSLIRKSTLQTKPVAMKLTGNDKNVKDDASIDSVTPSKNIEECDTNGAKLSQPDKQNGHTQSPIIFPYIPRRRQERNGLLIDYRYLPAAQESGDQIDFLILGENRVGVMLADVSGKMPAGTSPVLKTILRSNSTGLSAAATLRFLEQSLADSYTDKFKVTAFYAIFDQNKRVLHFASAGHLPMLLHRPSLAQTFLLNTFGAPLGKLVFDNDHSENGSTLYRSKIESEKIVLKQNDLLILYSDGLLAVRGKNGEYFGRQRLVDFVSRYGEYEPSAFVAALRELLDEFTEGKALDDDITVIALKNILRDHEKSLSQDDGNIAENFLTTDQEQKILDVLKKNSAASPEQILKKLSNANFSHITHSQIERYVRQNGRWIRPWPSQNKNDRALKKNDSQEHAFEEARRKKLQEELLTAFPLRKILNKKYQFRSNSKELGQAIEFFNHGDYQNALTVFLKIRDSIKESSTIRCFMGNLYLLLKMHGPAYQEFLEAINLDTDSYHALLAMAYLAILNEDYHTAIESLASALQLNPNYPEFQDFFEILIGTVEQRENQSVWLV